MISVTTYNLKGGEEAKKSLPKQVFERPVSNQLVAQAVQVQLANRRKAGAATKTRGLIAKTTAKMYRQKGTGRARHGSYAAPIFVGGGVAHGPSGEQNYKRRMSKILRKKALIGVLSNKADEKKIVVLKGGDKASGKTRECRTWRKMAGLEDKKVLVVVTNQQREIARSFKNLEKVNVVERERLGVVGILNCDVLVITDEAVEELAKTYESLK